MKDIQQDVVSRVRDRIDGGLTIRRVGDGLIFEHRNATHFVAEVDLHGAKITVPVIAEFSDHPDWSDDELVDHAMDVLRPRLKMYRQQGYRIREMEWQPGYQSPTYNEHQIPIFVAYLERELTDWEELYEELPWLLGKLATR